MFRWLFGGRSAPDAEEDFDHSTEAREPTNTPVEPLNLPITGRIVTDTASVVVFDPAALSHRVNDDCDWWAEPRDELRELSARNLLIVGLGQDGIYDLELKDEPIQDAPVFSLRAPGGTLFVGPGEELSGGGYQPDGAAGGYMISVEPGDYAVSVARKGDVLHLGLARAAPFENAASEPFKL